MFIETRQPGPVDLLFAFVFGSDDFAAEIGATRIRENMEILLARHRGYRGQGPHRLYARLCLHCLQTDGRRPGILLSAVRGLSWV